MKHSGVSSHHITNNIKTSCCFDKSCSINIFSKHYKKRILGIRINLYEIFDNIFEGLLTPNDFIKVAYKVDGVRYREESEHLCQSVSE